MKHYYEVYKITHSDQPLEPDGIDLKGSCEAIAFEDLESAVECANEIGAEDIAEIGGSWDEFKKCWFCEEWVPVTEMNKNNLCDHCENYLISRGEI